MAFETILIANRGEIALRVMRTAQRMGYRALAVYSDADGNAPHVRLADDACRIGPAAARDSYLNIDAILHAAHKHGADAVHPGYGFLAENAEFAQAVLNAGLTWIGPPPDAMRTMGNKGAAKRVLAERGVPLLPGYSGREQDDAELMRQAAQIGLPLMIKAAAGGGGRGMRLVTDAGELAAALAHARSEAEQSFGSGELILERALIAPRHIEVQVFADCHGTIVHLGERDCSVQRRHQKLIEETPSPAVNPELRAQLGAAAIEVARACAYVGAGTVEFLLDADGAFWFMEMNTRLQVEHPVTEAITGLDLVEWQLRVAAGERLPLTQHEIDARLANGGHAIEVRLCAEDPARDFLPQAGTVALWRAPPRIRVEHALECGQVVSPYYDSMVAKLIAHGATREETRRKALRQLDECLLLGLPSNQDFLGACLSHPEFTAGRADTSFVERNFPPEMRRPLAPEWTMQAVAAGLLLVRRMRTVSQRYPDELRGFCSTAALEYELEFELDGVRCILSARPLGGANWRFQGAAPGRTLDIAIAPEGADQLQLRFDGGSGSATTIVYAPQDDAIHLRAPGGNHVLLDLANRPALKKNGDASDGVVRAPMNGRVAYLKAAPGEQVAAGQTLIVLEAMKMEHALAAPCDGVLLALHVIQGDQVAPGQVLAEITPDARMEASAVRGSSPKGTSFGT